MGLTNSQVQILIVIERTTASVSVISTLLLISTFITIKAFRTLSNTLIFYASFANLFANVAALIGGSALGDLDGGLCQFQGFLLEMFMQSDPLWSCAMAVNVYLVFFRRFDAARLKKLYWIYAIICYGLPFIPAMFCLFYRTKEKGRMYGNATLWCWIDNDWALIRIYSYYAPIWLAILATFIIYVRVGVEIFQKRSELHKAGHDPNCGSATMDSKTDSKPAFLPPLVPFSGLRTTEIEITNDPWTTRLHSPSHSFARTEKTSGPQDLYSITIISSPPPTPCHHHPQTHSPRTPTTPKHPTSTHTHLPKRPSTMDKIKWAYTRCALLFAISILITWVPASVNRVHGLRYPNHPSFALNIGSALVLPLQGFWNAIIYFSTSLQICQDWWTGWGGERGTRNEGGRRRGERRGMRRSSALDIVHLGGRREDDQGAFGLGRMKSAGGESMVGLSRSSGGSSGESF